jgi:hypothetical protein
MLIKSKTILVTLLATSLASCAIPRGTSYPLPDYAAPINNQTGWIVKCPLRNLINEFDMRNSIFRNDDGSVKSLAQFCEENDSSKRTSR